MALAGGDGRKVIRSLSGELYDLSILGATWFRLPGVYSRMGYRPYYIRTDVNVPLSRSLRLLPTASQPIIDLFLMNNSKMTCDGVLMADASQGEVMLVSANDSTKGIRIKGLLRASGGAQIKIHE